MDQDQDSVRNAQNPLSYRPFLILLGLGVFVRVVLTFAYFPAVMLWVDAARFARVHPKGMFDDFWMPAGYPMFLALLRTVSSQMWFTIAVQHLLGLGVGILLFLSMRRLRSPPWVACLAAAVPFLSGDHLYFEHVIMADSFFIFLAAAGLAAAVYGLTNRAHWRWLCVASTLLALAALVRSVGAFLPPVLFICALAWMRKPSGVRWSVPTAIIFPALAVYGLYFAAFSLLHGKYLGFSAMYGWNLYSRVAPFADCEKFSPPQGTAILCDDKPMSQRSGPFGYTWDKDSIARRNFPLNPESGGKLSAFAHQVIRHQTGDYLHAVLVDLARHIEPTIGETREYSGQPREIVWFGWRDKAVERLVVNELKKKYHGTRVHLRWQEILSAYQNLFRVGGLALAVLIGLTFGGMIYGRGPLRLGIFLFGLAAIGLYLVPVITLSYDFRYGIPAETFIVVSGLLGGLALRPPDLRPPV